MKNKTKIVINDDVGVFTLTDQEKEEFMRQLDNSEDRLRNHIEFGNFDIIKRDDPRLVKAVQKVRDEDPAVLSSEFASKLKIVEVEGDWEIIEKNGKEYVIQRQTKVS